LRPAAEALRQALDGVDAEAFGRALDAEAQRRMEGFLNGIEAYRAHPYRRALPPVPVVWQEGTTRLLDYALPGATGAVVLVVPSLVNRGYILDLTHKRSLMRYLAEKSLRPFLVDWDAPGPEEKTFGLDDYICGRLGRVLDVVLTRAGRPSVVGYCMGGLLGLGLGLLRQDDVRGLALLATPWDFHQPDTTQAKMCNAMRAPLEDAIAMNGELPVDVLQTLFTTIDPGGCERKFRAFAAMTQRSAKARDFVAMEDWLNDGVPLAGPAAKECLFGWYVDNSAARGTWSLGGTPMRPEKFIKPALAMVPAKDRIVPPASALSLAEALPQARIRMVASGHIGMVTGRRAKSDVYSYLTKWLTRIAER
jgi:polyhydroxyalkanoate synthase